jgi:filamentous hemagglutinin
MRPPSLHRYLYAYANPTVYTDPSGRTGILSDAEEQTKESTKYYEERIAKLNKNDGILGAVGLGLGYGFASLGDFVVTGLNATSNLVARNLPDEYSTRQQAEQELAQAQDSMSQVIEGGANAEARIKEDPNGTAAVVATKAGNFTLNVLSGDPKSIAETVGFVAPILVPGAAAKTIKRAGEGLKALDAAASFERSALTEVNADLEEAYGAAGRGGIDVAHSPEIKVPFGTGVGQQGFAYENALAKGVQAADRLPPNFKTFDFFEDTIRRATSAKTLDTTTLSRIADPRRVYSTLRRGVDAAADFGGYTLGDTELLPEQIDLRAIRAAVPLETNATQWEQIKRAIDYAKERGVQLKPEVVTNSSR